MIINKQQGSTLAITLIILSVLTIASIGLIVSTQSSNVIAGNIAFKDSAASAGDIGIETAAIALRGINNLDSNIDNQYFARQQTLDNDGMPSTVNWNNVPSSQVQNYTVQYVIERFCTGSLPVTDIEKNCNLVLTNASTSKKTSAGVIQEPVLYFRITARVTGPKNTTSFIQAILSHQ